MTAGCAGGDINVCLMREQKKQSCTYLKQAQTHLDVFSAGTEHLVHVSKNISFARTKLSTETCKFLF